MTERKIRSDAFRTDGWLFPGQYGRTIAAVRDGIADSAEAVARSADGRHRAYLLTWRDPAGTCRMDSIFPGSTVARLEADRAARGSD